VWLGDEIGAQQQRLREPSASRSGCRVSGVSTAAFSRRPPGYPQGMDNRRAPKGDKRTVPGTGGPGPHEASVEGQKALQLHAGIAAIAVVLSAFVAWVFLRLGLVPFAVAFGGVAAISLLILGWALYRKRRGEEQQ
jgi:hypothetical protein